MAGGMQHTQRALMTVRTFHCPVRKSQSGGCSPCCCFCLEGAKKHDRDLAKGLRSPEHRPRIPLPLTAVGRLGRVS